MNKFLLMIAICIVCIFPNPTQVMSYPTENVMSPWLVLGMPDITGSPLQTTMYYGTVAFGLNGELFVTKSNQTRPGIYVIENGVMSCITCNDRKGFRDGPAKLALFDPAASGGYPSDTNVRMDRNTGDLYVIDGNNRRVRKVYKDGDGHWQVTTYAGGGSTSMTAGVEYDSLSVSLSGYTTMTVDSNSNLWIAGDGLLAKITPSGKAKRLSFPDSTYVNSPAGMDSDGLGNVYWISRGVSQIVKLTPSTETFYKYPTLQDSDPSSTWDGPIATASYRHPSNLAVELDGSAFYTTGGDESCIRRTKDGRISTFQTDGTWVERINDTGSFPFPGFCQQGTSELTSGWQLGGLAGIDDGYFYTTMRLFTLYLPLRKVEIP